MIPVSDGVVSFGPIFDLPVSASEGAFRYSCYAPEFRYWVDGYDEPFYFVVGWHEPWYWGA